MTDSKALIDWLQNNAVPVEPNHVIVERAKVTQIINHIEKLEADKALLREALGEIWEWIGNWSPDFIWDDEWPATEAKARAALQETIHDRD